jgi:hypothetical protein
MPEGRNHEYVRNRPRKSGTPPTTAPQPTTPTTESARAFVQKKEEERFSGLTNVAEKYCLDILPK